MKSMEFLLNALLFIAALNFPGDQARKSHCVVPAATTSNNWTRSCSSLSFYMQNVKHFVTSNVEINFNSGIHHLSSSLSVNNVTNVSIQGETNTTIWCHDTYLLITNSALINCGISFGKIQNKASINLHDVATFEMANTTFQNSIGYAIIGINIQGNSFFKTSKFFKTTA